MDLQKAAEAEAERRARSKLEEHRRAIMALRAKKWTYRQIAKWLNEHGVPVTFPSVYRFCERSIARRPRATRPPLEPPPPSTQAEPFLLQPPRTPAKSKPPLHKLDI